MLTGTKVMAAMVMVVLVSTFCEGTGQRSPRGICEMDSNGNVRHLGDANCDILNTHGSRRERRNIFGHIGSLTVDKVYKVETTTTEGPSTSTTPAVTPTIPSPTAGVKDRRSVFGQVGKMNVDTQINYGGRKRRAIFGHIHDLAVDHVQNVPGSGLPSYSGSGSGQPLNVDSMKFDYMNTMDSKDGSRVEAILSSDKPRMPGRIYGNVDNLIVGGPRPNFPPLVNNYY